MPKTPMMRSLLRMAREHALAMRRGVPVEAIREERQNLKDRAERRATEGLPSRRQVLAGGAAALGALMLPRGAQAAPAPRIAIIGGGISGLSAALTLRDAGVACTVYESAGRVGGRMFSNMGGYWADGQVSEWCGELIDTGHETIQALAARFGLALDDLHAAEPAGSSEVYHFFGSYYPKRQADRDFQKIVAALAADNDAAGYPTLYNSSTRVGRMLDDMSVFDWIEWRVPGGHSEPLGALLDVAYNIEYGAETVEQSALNLVYLLGAQPEDGKLSVFGESDEAFHIRGGNQQLPIAMAQHLGLGSTVQLGHRLLRVKKNSGSYSLTFQSANTTREVIADLVIMTIPFAVLRTLDIDHAGFNARKRRAIDELGRGHNSKLQLQFEGRPWLGRGPWPGKSNGSAFSDTGMQATWEVTRAQAGGHGILNDYLGGDAVGQLKSATAFGLGSNPGVRADAVRFIRQAHPVYPGLRDRWNNKATISIPHKDPHFGLAYSFWKPGQYHTISGYEAVPQGGVYFAGEHTSTDFQGYMEGGATEGIRAAQEVLAALGMP